MSRRGARSGSARAAVSRRRATRREDRLERLLRRLVSDVADGRRFFDPDWYLVRHPDLLSAGVDPFRHYARFGAREGRDPSPYVVARWYADVNPDVATSGLAVVEHLVEVGDAEGRDPSPFIDLAWYARRHPEVAASGLSPFVHLVRHGLAAGLAPSPFVDLEHYVASEPDVARSGMDAFVHFVTVGHGFGRFPHAAWDEDDYIASNPMVRAALALGKARSGFEHFCGRGHEQLVRGDVLVAYTIDGVTVEHREAAYLAAHPDVAAAVASGTVRDGVTHFFADGHRQMRAGTRPVEREAPPSATRMLAGRAPSPTADLGVLLAHHDVEGRADDHVLHAIGALVDGGADVHVITTSHDQDAHARLAEHATSVIVKDVNATTRDFGSWSLACARIGDEVLDRHRRVVLANDSSYFPVCDPGPMLAHLRASDADVWAATDSMSWDRYHVQSYFLALGPAVRRRIVAEVDRRIARHAGLSKAGLVQRFEVGLTQSALAEGMTIDVFRSVRGVLAGLGTEELARHRPAHPSASTITNLTHHLWRRIIEHEGLPFLKVELLRDNPLAIDISDWRTVVDPRFADVATIERHLARVRAASAH